MSKIDSEVGNLITPSEAVYNAKVRKALASIILQSVRNMDESDSLITRESLENMFQKLQFKQDQFAAAFKSDDILSQLGQEEHTAKPLETFLTAQEISDLKEQSRSDEIAFEIGKVNTADTKEGIVDEECLLAEKLKSCCDPFGREKKELIQESAKYFLRMGELYLEYTYRTTGMLQKQNFIKSAALVCGAMIRFEMAERSVEREVATDILRSVHQKLLIATGTRQPDGDGIFKLSTKLKKTLTEYRTREIRAIKAIHKTKEFIDIQGELTKIRTVRSLSAHATKLYIQLMRTVAEECVRIMGDPPCRFAILGLGSLARDEATLYSDFEHAIALENGVEKLKTYQEIKEYFRWYSVLFQIVIIGLGETFIRSVNVKSFCNLYSDDDSVNWYFDECTPCGIAFDGMAPHSCNVPLGRVEESKWKKHTVELIQTVSRMVKFLSKEEELKNGYFLKEVLSKTCFVYGDTCVYNDFVEKSNALMESENLQEVTRYLLKILLENPNEFIKWSVPTLNVIDISPKASNYRPVTTLIAFASRICGISTESSFKAVDEMKAMGLITDECHHSLSYAIAVTIEGRMRSYADSGQQRIKLSPNEWSGLVGVESAVECLVALFVMRIPIRQMLLGSFRKNYRWDFSLPPRRSAEWGITRLKMLLGCGFYEDVAESMLNIVYVTLRSFESREIDGDVTRFLLVPFLGMLQEAYLGVLYDGIQRFSKLGIDKRKYNPIHFLEEELVHCEWASKKIIEINRNRSQSLLAAHQVLCMVYFYKHRYEEGIREFDEWNAMYREIKSKIIHPIGTFVYMWQMDVDMRAKIMIGDHFVKYIEGTLVKEEELERRYVLKIALAKVLLDSDDASQTTRLFVQALMADLQNHPRKLVRSTYHKLFNDLRQMLRQLETARQRGRSIESAQTEKLASTPACSWPTQRMNKNKLNFLLQVRSIFVTSSYGEMVELVNRTIDDCKYCFAEGAIAKKYELPYAFSLMALFENVKTKHFSHAIHMYNSAPGGVKYLRALQPFIYGCLPDIVKKMDAQSIITCQRTIIMSLLGSDSDGSCWDWYRASLAHYTNLHFCDSVKGLWKILHSPDNVQLIKIKSMQLFAMAVLTILVVHKRKGKTPYFSKTKEISRKQMLWAWPGITRKNGSFMKSNIHESSRYLYSEEKLAPVFNLAVECFGIALPKCATLLWKILCSPDVTKRVGKGAVSLLLFSTTQILLHRKVGAIPACQ